MHLTYETWKCFHIARIRVVTITCVYFFHSLSVVSMEEMDRQQATSPEEKKVNISPNFPLLSCDSHPRFSKS